MRLQIKNKVSIDNYDFSSKIEVSLDKYNFNSKMKSQLSIEAFIEILKKYIFLWHTPMWYQGDYFER